MNRLTLARLIRLAMVGVLCGAAVACDDTDNILANPSLFGSNAVSVFCASTDEAGFLVGRPLDSCPDSDNLDVDSPSGVAAPGERNTSRRLYSLVSQPERGEIALVDMGFCAPGRGCAGDVKDLEQTQPGGNALPVGAEPVSVVSSSGGLASFVAVAEPGKEGLFGLPTRCLGPRPETAPYRDIRTWPACSLPAAPSAMELLRRSGSGSRAAGCLDETPAEEHECSVDLSEEAEAATQVLAVTLPERGSVIFVDAQALLNREPGSFDRCPVVDEVLLRSSPPSPMPEQELPSDLQGAGPLTQASEASGTVAAQRTPRPMDLAYSERQLFVADSGAPLLHVLDVSDVCQPAEAAPLLPRNLLDPDQVVTTRKVAVSPRTFGQGERFAYAVDASPGYLGGSLMVFDISSPDRSPVPLVRPRAREIPSEPPDRIRFPQEVADVTFVAQDFPEVDPVTGVAVSGVSCQPDPGVSGSAGSRYRADVSAFYGAPRPQKLRGVFAFAALHSGYVTAIDVEDLDAPCRRSDRINRESEPNDEGCSSDSFVTSDERLWTDVPTVSFEASCNVVLPHRARAGSIYNNAGSGSAPRLRNLPRLQAADGTALAVNQTERGRAHPRMLAVNFEPGTGATGGRSVGDAFVYVNTRRFGNLAVSDRLELDPAFSEKNSLVLPPAEPRAYLGDMTFSAVYEGVVIPSRVNSYHTEELGSAELAVSSAATYGVIEASIDENYCSYGIEDLELARGRGRDVLEVAAENLDEFGRKHADYVHVVNPLLPQEDAYWTTDGAEACGQGLPQAGAGLAGYELCEFHFGVNAFAGQRINANAAPRVRNREFRLVEAEKQRLVIEPRFDIGRREETLEMLSCCFPQRLSFEVRAGEQWVVRSQSGIEHDVVANRATEACERSQSPLRAGKTGRVFELSCSASEEDPDACVPPGLDDAAIGPSSLTDGVYSSGDAVACILGEHPSGGVLRQGGSGSECVHQSATARFAIYRGMEPTQRDMRFSWRVIGGFTHWQISLVDQVDRSSRATAPRALLHVPQINHLLVADTGVRGLWLLGLSDVFGRPGTNSAFAF